MGQILDIMNGIQQGAEDGRRAGLSRLVGKAYTADPAEQQRLLGLVAQRGEPGMAMQAQKGFDDQAGELHKQLAQRAQMVVQLYKANPQMAQQAYSAMLPLAARAGFPQAQAHPQLDDSLIPGLEKLASALNQSGGDDLKSLRIGANGNYWAIRGGQFIDTGTPADPRMQLRDQPGIDPSLVNLRTGEQTPLGGAPQQPQGPQRAPGEVPFSIDPSLPPEVQADIRANESRYAQAPEGAEIGIGGGGSAPMSAQGNLAAARPAVTPVQQQQLVLAQQAAQRAQEASQRAAQAQQLAQRGSAPTGYRFKPDGSLEPIPGAPASTQPGQRLSATALRQVNSAKAKLIDLQAVKNQLALVQDKFAPLKDSFAAGPFGGGLLPTEQGKRYDAAVSLLQQFVRKLTRTPGEGSMSDWEGKLAMLANPSRNDYESVTQDKIDQLNSLVNQIEQGYQSLLQDNQADITGPKQPAKQGDGSHDPLGIL